MSLKVECRIVVSLHEFLHLSFLKQEALERINHPRLTPLNEKEKQIFWRDINLA